MSIILGENTELDGMTDKNPRKRQASRTVDFKCFNASDFDVLYRGFQLLKKAYRKTKWDLLLYDLMGDQTFDINDIFDYVDTEIAKIKEPGLGQKSEFENIYHKAKGQKNFSKKRRVT